MNPTAGLWAGPSGLPAPLSTFVGREAEITELATQLGRARLVTVTGPAGVGKSRLALTVAQRLRPAFPEGAWWAPLADLSDPAEVLAALANAVDVDTSALVDVLSTSRALLVWDDGGHLGDTVTELVGELLARCPGLRILATGRHGLGVPGEVRWVLAPLATPPAADADVDVAGYDAVRLFVDRARHVLPRFDATGDLAAIATVCRRVDGLPLAVELAAARVNVLSVPQIAERLTDALPLLDGNRAGPHRHRSLRAGLDRGYDLLGAAERELFARLSVFTGPFDLDAVEALRPGQALDILAELVDRSLVTVVSDGHRVRYRLLEPIRQYAATKLAEHEVPDLQVVRPRPPVEVVPAELRIQALGAARVYRDGTLLDAQAWTYAKPRELLYFLLGRPDATKEQIGAALWPWISPKALRNSFHTTLHHLRRALGDPGWITYQHGRYAFNRRRPHHWDVDVLRSGLAHLDSTDPGALAALATAADAYHGDFLVDLPGGQWIDARRVELRTTYEEVLMALGRGYARTGRLPLAVRTYERAIAHDNLLEVAHRELIRCYAASGERPRALRHYADLVTLLREQLGVPPSAATRELYAELRADLGRNANPPAPATAPPQAPAARLHSVAAEPTTRGTTGDSRPDTACR